MPKTKKNQLCWDKRTLVALTGEAEGNSLACRGTCGMGEQSGTTLSSGKCMVPPHLPLEKRSSGEKAQQWQF